MEQNLSVQVIEWEDEWFVLHRRRGAWRIVFKGTYADASKEAQALAFDLVEQASGR